MRLRESLDMRRELRPAEEPVLAGDEELRVGQPASGASLVLLLKTHPALFDAQRFAIDLALQVVGQLHALQPGQRFEPADRPPADGSGIGRSARVWAVHWTADGESLLTAGTDGNVRMWESASGAEQKTFNWDIGKLYCAAFSPDGLTCAACGEKGQVVVWDVDA